MKIGIDIDNTICSTDELLDKKIDDYIKEKGMSQKEFFSDIKYMSDFYEEKLLEVVFEDQVKDGFLDVLNKLKINNEIIIVTARNEKLSRSFQNMRKATLEWLEKNNIYYDKYYDDAYKEGKVKVCKDEAIDIIIDDDINNYLAFKDSGIKTLLFDDKGKYLDIVDRVGSWREVEEVLFND
ncbi:yqfW [Mycoplasma sp. CAG:877]|nr:yqfW [Mycoplasma sp. CAG:877]